MPSTLPSTLPALLAVLLLPVLVDVCEAPQAVVVLLMVLVNSAGWSSVA
jgi:hypothetical protein